MEVLGGRAATWMATDLRMSMAGVEGVVGSSAVSGLGLGKPGISRLGGFSFVRRPGCSSTTRWVRFREPQHRLHVAAWVPTQMLRRAQPAESQDVSFHGIGLPPPSPLACHLGRGDIEDAVHQAA